MATLKMDGIDEIIKSLNNVAGGLDAAMIDAIDAAKPTLQGALSDCITESANRGYATGELAGSIQPTKTKKSAYGYYADVRPTGTDRKGVRNGEKLAYLEYGTSRQVAHPVMGRALDKAEEPCGQIMLDSFQRAVDKLW